MKSLTTILAVMMLIGCSGMQTSGGSGMSSGTSSMGGGGSTNQVDINRHDDPNDPYFGG